MGKMGKFDRSLFLGFAVFISIFAATRISQPSWRSRKPYCALKYRAMDLPCSHEILWLHAGGTNPGSLPDAHRVVPGNTAFPIER